VTPVQDLREACGFLEGTTKLSPMRVERAELRLSLLILGTGDIGRTGTIPAGRQVAFVPDNDPPEVNGPTHGAMVCQLQEGHTRGERPVRFSRLISARPFLRLSDRELQNF
jgi:hypothetical protein